eukprot:COSAG02_NODE_1_length_108762_cov_456.708287_87_plen_73_part_00
MKKWCAHPSAIPLFAAILSPLCARYLALADVWQMKIAAVAGQGIRRTAYGGVVTLHKDGARIFVTPQGFTGI